MDPELLAKLPDAAKLGILRHLAIAEGPPQPAAPAPARGGCPTPAALGRQQEGAQPPAAAAAGLDAVPGAVQGRRMEGGLAITDGFLDAADVEAAREEARAVLQERARNAGMVAAASAGPPGSADAAAGTSGAPAKPAADTWVSSSTRGDRAAWLNPSLLSQAGHSQLAAAARRLLALRPWLAAQGWDVGGRPSLQLACYPGGGARYVRHRDASASVPGRSVTAILYLNPAWEAGHGGSLCVYATSTIGSDPCSASPADLRLSGGGRRQAEHAAAGQVPAGQAAAGQTAEGPAAQLPQPPAQQQPGQQAAGSSAASPPAIGSGLDEGHPATVVPPLGGRLVVMDSRLLHEVLPAHAERYALTAWFSRAPSPAQAAAALAESFVPEQAAEQGHAGTQQPPPPPEQQQQQASAAAGPGAAAGAQQLPSTAQQLDSSSITAPGHIFVSIPAYRDSEAHWTLGDLFAKAAHPERVSVGIAWQLNLPADAGMMRLAGDQRWLRQVRQVVLPAGEATGPCKARALAQQLWEGEEFHLQIDSHMRFAEGWDAALLRMLRQAEAAAGHPRVVLSAYPAGYEGEGPDARLPGDPLPTLLCASHWGEEDGLLRIRGRKLQEPLAAPAPALFWAAGLSFSRSQLILEAPYRRDLPGLFFGEEMLQLQTMWRAGWDVFTPCATVAFHLWSRKHRPTLQQDRAGEEAGAERLAEQRQRSQQAVAAALAGDSSAGSEDSKGACSSGRRLQQRSVQDFWRHVGVDFRAGSKAISKQALNGGMPAEAFLSADS